MTKTLSKFDNKFTCDFKDIFHIKKLKEKPKLIGAKVLFLRAGKSDLLKKEQMIVGLVHSISKKNEEIAGSEEPFTTARKANMMQGTLSKRQAEDS